ncbi:hypothetical protein, partial [Salmonella enterica]|uniref:hypothetical protein n=1 Tax=Salmonella enterica TaxID=28901 RepID=UPI0032979028
MTTFTMNPMMPSEPAIARSTVRLFRRYRSIHAEAAAAAQTPTCQKSAIVTIVVATRAIRGP